MSFPYFQVLPGHELAYNEVVKPNRRWAFSYYFLYRWLPLLHPQQAMLIQLLRQATWRDGKPTGRCQLSNAILCRMLGWSESSHKSLLNELERPFSEWFVRRERTRKRHATLGHAVEGAPRYRVQMDDPLTPGDQAALSALFASVEPSTPYQAAEWLMGLAARPTRALWSLLDEQSVGRGLPDTNTTLLELARQAWPHLWESPPGDLRALRDAAEQLQLRVTGAGYAHMELDYLRRSWLPALGVNQTWLAIILRARCFHDPTTHETRDVVTISRKQLEEQLAIPARTFRRLLRDEALVPFFLTSAPGEAADPQSPREMPHRGDVAFSVAFPLVPVAPGDRPRYEALLLSRDAGELEISTGGHSTHLRPATRPDSAEEDLHNRPPDPARTGHSTRLKGGQPAPGPGSNRSLDPAERGATGHSTRLEPATRPTIPLPTNRQEASTYQKSTLPSTLGEGEETGKRTEIEALLAPFGIKNLGAILENEALSVAEVRGWILRGREEVDPPQMAGYLYNRLRPASDLRAYDPLPPRYEVAGAIEPEEATLFEQWWMDERAIPVGADPAQAERYRAWLWVVKGETGERGHVDFSPRARWRREMARREYDYLTT